MLVSEAAKILGLTIPFSAVEAKSAYRRLAMDTHPDKGGGSSEAFGQVGEAYKLCSKGVDYSFGVAPKVCIDGTEFRAVKKSVSIKGEVNWFAARILDKMMVHRHKGASWRQERAWHLYKKMLNECKELADELGADKKDKNKIINECADVAAFAMMIADKARRL